MPATSALHTIGYYCGRNGSGLFDEPQNSFSNIAFLIGALLAYRVWRATENPDRFIPVLVLMLGGIGVGSFIFHSYPTAGTLYIDLIPIQLYILTALGYALNRVFRCTWTASALLVVSFLVLRQAWIYLVPQGLLGGGVTHIPTLVVLLLCIVISAIRGLPLWKYLLVGAGCYWAALVVRSWDVPLCSQFPFGLHWAWHILSAVNATIVLIALIRSREQVRVEA